MRGEFVAIDIVGHDGLTILSRGLVLVRPERADSLAVLAHELAHVATARKGYRDESNERYFLRPAGAPDPDWIDVDALVATRCLLEADAEITERAALAFQEAGDAAVSALWKERSPVLPADGVGPLRVVKPDGSVAVDVGAGEPFHDRTSTVAKLLGKLAYEGSLALVKARHRENENLEETLRRTWETFSYSTREIFVPEKPPLGPANLARAARSLGVPAHGALRVGAFLIFCFLYRKSDLAIDDVLKLIDAFEDDLLVRTYADAGAGSLWVTKWATPSAAERFASIYGKVLEPGSVASEGNWVTAQLGEAPAKKEIVQKLKAN